MSNSLKYLTERNADVWAAHFVKVEVHSTSSWVVMKDFLANLYS